LVFVNIDIDIHSSCVEALNFVEPMLAVGTVIYLDDFRDPMDVGKGPEYWGENLSWKQFGEAHPNIKFREIIKNELNQCAFVVEAV
jgi:hypothetical protein